MVDICVFVDLVSASGLTSWLCWNKASSSYARNIHIVHISLKHALDYIVHLSAFFQSVQLYGNLFLDTPSESKRNMLSQCLWSRGFRALISLMHPTKWHLDMQKKTCYAMTPLWEWCKETRQCCYECSVIYALTTNHWMHAEAGWFLLKIHGTAWLSRKWLRGARCTLRSWQKCLLESKVIPIEPSSLFSIYHIGRKKSNTTCKYTFDTKYLSKKSRIF